MKELIQSLEKLEREWRCMTAGIACCAWLLCLLIVWVVALLNDPSEIEIFPVGTLVFLMAVVCMQYFASSNFLVYYRLSVSMGRTRQSFLTAHLILDVLYSLLMLTAAFLFYRLELFLHGCMGIVKYGAQLDAVFQIQTMFILAALLSVSNVFVGALYLWKAWIPSVCWIALCLTIGKTTENAVKGKGILHWLYTYLQGLPPYGAMFLALLLAAVLWGTGRRILFWKS